MCCYFRGKCYDNFMKNELIIVDLQTRVPAAIAAAGEPARKRFIEFFTANIRNRNTRLAYARAVSDFFAWCERAGLSTLELLQPVHVAAYVEQLSQTRSAPSVKTAPGGNPDALRLARCRPGDTKQPGIAGPWAKPCR